MSSIWVILYIYVILYIIQSRWSNSSDRNIYDFWPIKLGSPIERLWIIIRFRMRCLFLNLFLNFFVCLKIISCKWIICDFCKLIAQRTARTENCRIIKRWCFFFWICCFRCQLKMHLLNILCIYVYYICAPWFSIARSFALCITYRLDTTLCVWLDPAEC